MSTLHSSAPHYLGGHPQTSHSLISRALLGTLRTKKMLVLAMGLAAVALTPSVVSAQTSSAAAGLQRIEEIFTVGTRLDDDFAISENLVVDSADLARLRPANAERLFQQLPGFSVSQPGGPGGVSEIFLRGAESNFTAVYVDGVRLNNSSNTRGGSFDSSLLNIYDVDRIDVATGAMSAIYGADAMAGIINVRTDWAKPGMSKVLLEAGSVDDWRVGAATSVALDDDLEWSFRASALDGGEEIEGSSLRLKSFGTRLAGQWSNSGSWDFSVRHVQRDRSSFSEVSGGPQYAVIRALETGEGDELSVAASSDWSISDRWSSGVYVSGTRMRDDVASPAVAPGALDGQPAFSSITEYERAQLLWVNRIELAPHFHLATGIDSVVESGSDEGSVDLGFAVLPNVYELDRSVYSAFAELGKQWNQGLTATLAVRWDDADQAERLSGKLGIEQQVSENGSSVWARIANGFKLPSFFALGNPLYGNPNLVAEKARNAEAGYTHVFGGGAKLTVAAFKNRYEDLVDFDFASFTNVNRGVFEVSGVEIRTLVELTPVLRMQVDGTWSEISSNSGALRRRPEQTGGMSLHWSPTQAWQANLSLRYVGSRLITSIPTGDVDAPGFTILGATGSYALSQNQVVWVAIDNALDEDYQDAPGFPSPGAQIRVGTKLTF